MRGRGDRRGIASTADAIIFLALMLLATSAMYGFAATTDDPADEMAWERDVAGWTLDALLRCTTDEGVAFSDSLLMGNNIDGIWLNATMDVLVKEGRGWSLWWNGAAYGEVAKGDRVSAIREIPQGGVVALTIWRL